MFGSRCFLNRCITSRTPTSDNKKRNQKTQIEQWNRWKRQKFYTLPVFPKPLKSNATNEQRIMLEYFENFPFIEKKEDFNKENTNYSIIYLRQEHFKNGTVRITRPGIYVLQEDIIFEPNKNNDFFPTMNQITSGQYPSFSSGPYHLGFFAAITIESDDVLLNLNQKTIKQSALHNLQQRFYANIELASSPFIPAQGPGNFGSSVVMPTNVLIHNGTLGLSSHHGIHGNGMQKVCLADLTITDMEVAAIALNGAEQSVLYNIHVRSTFTKIPILSTYSQGRFIRQFLKRLKGTTPDANIMIDNTVKDIDTIITELENELDATKDSILLSGVIPNNIFGNVSQLYDGNVYGIVLNVRGVVINDFIKTRPTDASGNRNIYLQNITLDKTISEPLEIIAISSAPSEETAYGGKRQVGPAGDVFHISLATDNDRTYKLNTLANAQLLLAKYNNPKIGTTNIEMPILDWVENNTDIDNVMAANDYYYVNGGDSMGHAMKGNIGLFVSAGENIVIKNTTITNVVNRGTSVGTSTLIADASQNKQGALSTGILFTGTKNVLMNITTINNIESDNGDAAGMYIMSSSNITRGGTAISNIKAVNGTALEIREE